MDNIFEFEKLNSIRNEMTHLWGSACATTGGAIVLALSSEATISYYIMATFGLFAGIIMINAYFVRRTEVVKILKKMGGK